MESIKNPQRKLQILVSIIGILLIVPLCYEMITGFILGWNSPSVVENTAQISSYPLVVELQPTSDQSETFDSTQETIIGNDLARDVILYMPQSAYSPVISIINTIISLLAIIMAIYYIIGVIKFVIIVMRDGFITRTTLKQLRRISFSMLSAYLLFFLSSYLPIWYYSEQITLLDYTFEYPDISESMVIAIILILLTEILNIALHLKEEQDLTI